MSGQQETHGREPSLPVRKKRSPSSKISELPADVMAFKKSLAESPEHELTNIASKLLKSTSDLITMWRTLERRNYEDGSEWVLRFVEAAHGAVNLPPYHYLKNAERAQLISDIKSHTETLVGLISANELDTRIRCYQGEPIDFVFNADDPFLRAIKDKMIAARLPDDPFTFIDDVEAHEFSGTYYVYIERGSDAPPERIDPGHLVEKGVAKIIEDWSKNAIQRISDEPRPGKVGKNAPAIRFARELVEHNLSRSRFLARLQARQARRDRTATLIGASPKIEPLYSVVAAATNALYGTNYQESDIRNLIRGNRTL